ncbi:MAG: glutamyl-tRNA reductase [Candidatus Manganitrophus sp.]|nr:glutamyl-tRNA reductase [Candidatus Manganitrophus sp.]
MAELAARHFVGNGVQSVAIANRSYERSLELAKEFNGVPVKFEDFVAQMAESDIVLCSTGAPHYLIGVEEVSKVIAIRQNRPIFFIDISVPRNIDPAINKLDNVFLYDIDDLQLAVETNLRAREQEALKADQIIDEEIERFSRWFKSLDAVPMIVALRDRAEEIRKAEIEKIVGKLGPLTPAQREMLESLTSSIVNKLLHNPLTVLKEEAHSTNGNMILEATRRLFHLEEVLSKLDEEKKAPPRNRCNEPGHRTSPVAGLSDSLPYQLSTRSQSGQPKTDSSAGGSCYGRAESRSVVSSGSSAAWKGRSLPFDGEFQHR